MQSTLRRLWRQQSGQDIPEYALLVALIAIVIIAAIYTYGLANSNKLGGATDGLKAAAPAAGQGGGGGGSSGQGSGDAGQGQGGQGGSGGIGGGQGGDGGGGGQCGVGRGGQGGQGGSGGGLPTDPKPIKPS